MTRQKILFVDDDIPKGSLDGYLAELRKVYDVVCVERAVDVGPALALHKDVCAIVLDLFMAVPPQIDPRSVDGGQLTGLWVLRDSRMAIDARRIRILVLTNRVPKRDVQPLLDEERARYPMDVLIRLYRKTDTKAAMLPILVKRHLDEISGAESTG